MGEHFCKTLLKKDPQKEKKDSLGVDQNPNLKNGRICKSRFRTCYAEIRHRDILNILR